MMVGVDGQGPWSEEMLVVGGTKAIERIDLPTEHVGDADRRGDGVRARSRRVQARQSSAKTYTLS